MSLERFRAWQQRSNTALLRHLPVAEEERWLSELVDPPRFGWDWAALQHGFFAPLHAWARRHDARLRPVLACWLIEALGGDSARHSAIIAALEIEYLAAIMLDDLRNGRDLSSSTASAVTVPLPVWVTIAYNARQLGPVLIARRATELPGPARQRLVSRFGQFLVKQGLGNALDLWGSEHGRPHAAVETLIQHLSLYIGALSFGLACEVAAAAVGLDQARSEQLARVGVELGIALRLAELSAGADRRIQVNGSSSTEQRIRWRADLPQASLREAGQRLRQSALSRAGSLSAPVAAALSGFLAVLDQPAAASLTS